MGTRLSLLALLLLSVLGRSVDAQDPPRYDRIATDRQCRIIKETPVLFGSVEFKAVKPGLAIPLKTEAILRRGGVQVESVILDVIAQPPSAASDCGGACVVPDDACLSYVSGGVQGCGSIAFDIQFATFPAPGETFELELVGTPGSAVEFDTTNDTQKKEIPPETAVGQSPPNST